MLCFFFFFFNDTATTEIYTLSLHDALPIFILSRDRFGIKPLFLADTGRSLAFASELRCFDRELDRKSTRLNSSHSQISYAVFCLKKKKKVTCAILTTRYAHFCASPTTMLD